MTPPEWQDGEPQPGGGGGGRSTYPTHFTPAMIEVYDEMMKQIKMCMVYFGISMEEARDVLRLIQSDILYNKPRNI